MTRTEDVEEEEEELDYLEQYPDGINDSVALYLQDIGKVPLLTAAQEVDLAKRIERGEAAQAKFNDPELTLDRG